MTSKYQNLPEYVALPDTDFDDYFAFVQEQLSDVLDDSDDKLEMPQAGFKKALRTAFTAGKLAVLSPLNEANGLN